MLVGEAEVEFFLYHLTVKVMSDEHNLQQADAESFITVA